jgi:hypothetical protein
VNLLVFGTMDKAEVGFIVGMNDGLIVGILVGFFVAEEKAVTEGARKGVGALLARVGELGVGWDERKKDERSVVWRVEQWVDEKAGKWDEKLVGEWVDSRENEMAEQLADWLVN